MGSSVAIVGGIGLDVGLLDLVSCTIVKNSTKLWVSGLAMGVVWVLVLKLIITE